MTGVIGVPGVDGVALGVARGEPPGVVPGVAGVMTTGVTPGSSATAPPARDSSRGVEVTKRASLMRYGLR